MIQLGKFSQAGMERAADLRGGATPRASNSVRLASIELIWIINHTKRQLILFTSEHDSRMDSND